MDYNKVIISRRLTRAPELRSLPSGQHVCEFTVATNRIYTDAGGTKQEVTEFHNVVARGRQADTICQYAKIRNDDPVGWAAPQPVVGQRRREALQNRDYRGLIQAWAESIETS